MLWLSLIHIFLVISSASQECFEAEDGLLHVYHSCQAWWFSIFGTHKPFRNYACAHANRGNTADSGMTDSAQVAQLQTGRVAHIPHVHWSHWYLSQLFLMDFRKVIEIIVVKITQAPDSSAQILLASHKQGGDFFSSATWNPFRKLHCATQAVQHNWQNFTHVHSHMAWWNS